MNIITNDDSLAMTVLSALKDVIDPEIRLNIVDLGLIYQIDIDDAGKLYCTMTLTTQFCPMGESILDEVRKTLQMNFPHHQIILNLTFNPAWNHEMISEVGRRHLNR